MVNGRLIKLCFWLMVHSDKVGSGEWWSDKVIFLVNGGVIKLCFW